VRGAGCGVRTVGVGCGTEENKNNSKTDEITRKKKITKHIHKNNSKIQAKYKNKETIEYLHITRTNK